MRKDRPTLLASAAVIMLFQLAHDSASGPTYAQAPDSIVVKEALIHRLLDLTQTADLAVRTLEAAIPAQRASRPNVPNEFWEELAGHAKAEKDHLVEMLVPVYGTQFTTQQLKELVAFYESPSGRHLTDVQPALSVGAMQVAQQWGAQLSSEAVQALARRGIRLPLR